MCNIISVANIEVGVGRTATAVNFAASLSVLEKKTLIVDCDPKGDVSKYLGVSPETYDYGLEDLLAGLVSGRAVVRDTKISYLDFIPSGHNLKAINDHLKFNPEKEKVLEIVIRKFRDNYDYIIFDTPSGKGLLTQSALIASDSLLLPVVCDKNAALNFSDMLGYVSRAREGMASSIKMSGVIVNKCSNIQEFTVNFSDGELNELQPVLYTSTIPESSVPEASIENGHPACLLDIKSEFSEAFLDLSFEFLYREEI